MGSIKTQKFNGFNHIESELFRELEDESIELYGIPVYYIMGDSANDNLDRLHGENPLRAFNKCWEMTWDLEGFDAYIGGRSYNNIDGQTFLLQQGLDIERERFKQYCLSNTTGLPELLEPRNDDLIFIPMFNKFFIIKGFDDIGKSEFYTHGINHTFHVNVEVWDYSHETISTGVTEIDDAAPTTASPFIVDENDVVEDIDLKNEITQDFVDWADNSKNKK